MYSYLYKYYPVENSVPFQESVSSTRTTNDKMSVRMNIRGRRRSRRSKSNDTRCRRTIPIAKSIAASISVSLSISISILFVTKFILFTEVSPHVISDDRVRSLDTSPALGRGYSIMTNGFLSTSSLMVDETTVPSYNYDCKLWFKEAKRYRQMMFVSWIRSLSFLQHFIWIDSNECDDYSFLISFQWLWLWFLSWLRLWLQSMNTFKLNWIQFNWIKFQMNTYTIY